jgi:hypothetical protein
MTIAALQYAALREAWPKKLSEEDDLVWGTGMEVLWQQMTPEEQQAEEDGIRQRAASRLRSLRQ